MKSSIISSYFPSLSVHQQRQFEQLFDLYKDWNSKINVISRKDLDHLYLHHVLHSLGIAKVVEFLPDAHILDIGTGGGFPGIPLAILFPETNFTLVDAIGKKIKVVTEVAQGIGLKNIDAHHKRGEQIGGAYDFIVSRAVTAMPKFMQWTKGKFKSKSRHELPNGVLYLKGGDLRDELAEFPHARQIPLSLFFKEDFFETKQVVYLKN